MARSLISPRLEVSSSPLCENTTLDKSAIGTLSKSELWQASVVAARMTLEEALRLTQSTRTSKKDLEDLAWRWFAGEWDSPVALREAILANPSSPDRVRAAFDYMKKPILFNDVIDRLLRPRLEVTDKKSGYPARDVKQLLRRCAEQVWIGRDVASLVKNAKLKTMVSRSNAPDYVPLYDKAIVDNLLGWVSRASMIVCDPRRYVAPPLSAKLPDAEPTPLPPNATSLLSDAPTDMQNPVTTPPEAAPASSAIETLNNMIGLSRVKAEAEELQARAAFARERRSRRMKQGPMLQHLVFLGNPGTGKTTVARLVGRMYYELGLLPSDSFIEVKRTDFISPNVGGTDDKAKKLLDKAKGGVLFIDEAYSLVRNDSGWEPGKAVIDELTAVMENERENFVLILAGYEKEMNDFLSANPGLQSRLPEQWIFEDYSNDELALIGRNYATEQGYVVDDDTLRALRAVFQRAPRSRNFGNGRVARNVVEDAMNRMLMRFKNVPTAALTNDDLSRLLPEDVDERLGPDADTPRESPALKQLNDLVGIAPVKEAVQQFVSSLRIEQLRAAVELPTESVSRHMVFGGSPGTGKTTVAGLLGQALKDVDAVRTGTYRKVGRNDLVAGYQGQTAIKARAAIESALGGVLFLDEAYSLKQTDNDSFGQEAIDTLVELMDLYRDDLIVIAAGYSDRMSAFLDANPGLRSRFIRWVEFPSYDDDELLIIWNGLLSGAGYTCDDTTRGLVRRLLTEQRGLRKDNFANAREVRNLFDLTKAVQAVRLDKQNARTREALAEITSGDVGKAAEFLLAQP